MKRFGIAGLEAVTRVLLYELTLLMLIVQDMTCASLESSCFAHEVVLHLGSTANLLTFAPSAGCAGSGLEIPQNPVLVGSPESAKLWLRR